VATTYQLKILTPQRKVLDEPIESLVAPGAAGYLGVLANHAPIVTTLVDGTLKVRASGTEKWYHIAGGILRVARNSAVLLSERVEEVPVGQ
jgi:F-type H+-transporting ATPase subunit epsilon